MYVELIVWFPIMAWLERVDSCSKGGRCGEWVAKAGRGKSSQLWWGVNKVAGVVAGMFVEFTWGSAGKLISTIRILSDTLSEWYTQWVSHLEPQGGPRRGLCCPPHSPCLRGCMHGWGLVLCICVHRVQCCSNAKHSGIICKTVAYIIRPKVV